MTKESEKESRVVVDLASIMLHGSIQMTSLKSAPQVALTDLCVDFILFCYNVQCRAIYIIVYIRRFFFFLSYYPSISSLSFRLLLCHLHCWRMDG